MGVTPEEWSTAIDTVDRIKKDALYGEGHTEDLITVLDTAYARSPQEWVKNLSETADKREEFGALEEHFSKNVEPVLDENIPAGIGMSAGEKSYSHGRVTYIESHMDKLEETAKRAPKVLRAASNVRTELATLSSEITADPLHLTRNPRSRARERHTPSRLSPSQRIPVRADRGAPVASRRGLTPRQRRRS